MACVLSIECPSKKLIILLMSVFKMLQVRHISYAILASLSFAVGLNTPRASSCQNYYFLKFTCAKVLSGTNTAAYLFTVSLCDRQYSLMLMLLHDCSCLPFALQVQDGWLAAGYRYIIVDDCWPSMSRDAQGRLQPDPARFPSGMAVSIIAI